MRYALFVCVAGVCVAQPAIGGIGLELRIVELTGQKAVNASDPVLDLAIQARVTGGANLRNFNLDMRVVGEPESNGSLARGLIQNFDGTYSTTLGVNSAVGRGGVAQQYSFDAHINASFNGLINTSAATFTNGPDQEIGLIVGAAVGTPLLATPGMDLDNDGNPDTWVGNGSGMMPANNTLAPVDPSLAGPYFANGQFIDIYRFRYTVFNFNARTLVFDLRNANGGVFTELGYANGLWGSYIGSTDAIPTVTALQIPVVPAPGGLCVIFAALPLMSRSRRAR